MQDFRNIDAWKRAHHVVLDVYRITQGFPKEETFGLTIQLRRNASSVATRIAEGAGRMSDMEFASDLRRAVASASELEYGVLLARDLGMLQVPEAEALSKDIVETRKMTLGLLRKLQSTSP